LVKGRNHVVHPYEGDNDIHTGILSEQVLELQDMVARARAITTNVAHPHLSSVHGPAEIHLQEMGPDLRVIQRTTQGGAAPDGEDAILGAIISEGPSPHAETVHMDVRHPIQPVKHLGLGYQCPSGAWRKRGVTAGGRH
jgi:hypothetical protein